MLEIFESDFLLKKIIKYFGHDNEILSIILAKYDQKLGEQREIQFLLEEKEVKKYVNLKLKQEQSMNEFIDIADEFGPILIELASNNDIAIIDPSLNTWLKHVIDKEIK